MEASRWRPPEAVRGGKSRFRNRYLVGEGSGEGGVKTRTVLVRTYLVRRQGPASGGSESARRRNLVTM